ncbi:hypothetical protein PIROE2DRAFT_18406 [Piromyces sp. E2]|nr:hypothetical protein PIROE2DRAFT_18406 [Piromyces sp. E2]|eukprot:OUM56823.1 hypothetical protein PIROE2DRAFT_18406 [Piromyces sp. E2]
MCGFGEKDRRPIDPPPICELLCFNEQGERIGISNSKAFYKVPLTNVSSWNLF